MNCTLQGSKDKHKNRGWGNSILGSIIYNFQDLETIKWSNNK